MSDLAILQVEGLESTLPEAKLGDSDGVRVGDWVVAVGNPVGLDNTVTCGIISSLRRSSTEVGVPFKKIDFIQTDAAINPGNSGGPLVDSEGRVVGINTCIRANAEGIGFAIPVNKARDVGGRLARGESITHAYIGVQMSSMTPGLANSFNSDPNSVGRVAAEFGAVVIRVVPGTPADSCGFRKLDVITSVNKVRVKNKEDAGRIVDELEVGKEVEVVVVRDGKERMLRVRAEDLGAKLREAGKKEAAHDPNRRR